MSATAIFGLLVCIHYNAPIYAFVIGFLCLLVDDK